MKSEEIITKDLSDSDGRMPKEETNDSFPDSPKKKKKKKQSKGKKGKDDKVEKGEKVKKRDKKKKLEVSAMMTNTCHGQGQSLIYITRFKCE